MSPLLLLPLLALEPTAESAKDAPTPEATSELPVRAADRPDLLPAGAMHLEVDWQVGPGTTRTPASSSVLSMGVGLTDRLEAGAWLGNFTLSPSASAGPPLVYVSYSAVPWEWSIVPSVQLTLPSGTQQDWIADGMVFVSGSIGKAFSLTLVPTLTVSFERPAAVTAALPVQGVFQITDRFQAGLLTGVGFAAFEPRRHTAPLLEEAFDVNEVSLELGANVVYTVGKNGGPFADLGLQLQWPDLLRNRRAGGAETNVGAWNLLFSVATYFR